MQKNIKQIGFAIPSTLADIFLLYEQTERHLHLLAHLPRHRPPYRPSFPLRVGESCCIEWSQGHEYPQYFARAGGLTLTGNLILNEEGNDQIVHIAYTPTENNVRSTRLGDQEAIRQLGENTLTVG
ncbi:MAG: hypothetical protein ABIJ65_01870 [Chloroflexota bacterium]